MNPARLMPLLHRAQQQEDQAARTLAQQQQTLHQHQQRLAELHRYREEYTAVPTAFSHLGQVLSYRSFVQRLNHAIQQHTRHTQQQHAQVHTQRQHLLAARQATQKLEQLLQQGRTRQQHIQARHTVRQLDDVAAYRTFCSQHCL